jgi:glucans biosynthesis protein C
MTNPGTPELTTPAGRRVELDWLRIGSVLLVFLHHVCMPFNGDHFHIMNAQSSKVLDDIMVYFEQWRLPLLLLISGAGTVMAFSRHSAFGFAKERSRRLFIPLIVGVLLIVPPQTYFEFRSQFGSYLDFYSQLFDNLEYNHLWFIKYLFFFSLIVIPLVLYLRSERSALIKERIGTVLAKPAVMLLLCVPVILLRIVSLVYFPDADEAWLNFPKAAYYFYFFSVGIILFSCINAWNSLAFSRRKYLVAALISFVLFYVYYYFPQEWIPESVSVASRWSIWFIVCALVGWSTMLAIMGYAQVYLNHPKPALKKLNEAVYPFYILHQTVIVVAAYYIVQWDTSIWIKLPVLLVVSFCIIVLLYRMLIYPFNAVRFLFGMKRL